MDIWIDGIKADPIFLLSALENGNRVNIDIGEKQQEKKLYEITAYEKFNQFHGEKYGTKTAHMTPLEVLKYVLNFDRQDRYFDFEIKVIEG